MAQSEIFIGKLLSAIDGTRSSAITIDEITTLDHEIFDLRRVRFSVHLSGFDTYHSMELAAFVALGLTLGIFGLAGAELAEILCCSRGDVCKQFHLDPAEGLPCGGLVADIMKKFRTYRRGRYQKTRQDWSL